MAFSKKTPPTSKTNEGGLKSELSTFLRDSSTYLRLRGELFSIEAKEAAQIYSKKLSYLLIGCGLALFGYITLISSLIGIIGNLFSGADFTLANWAGAALLIALVHIILGTIFILKGRALGSGKSLFEYTRSELQTEKTWLNQTNKRS